VHHLACHGAIAPDTYSHISPQKQLRSQFSHSFTSLGEMPSPEENHFTEYNKHRFGLLFYCFSARSG
jgi:hypothetical protein